jgi:hypothetical protein
MKLVQLFFDQILGPGSTNLVQDLLSIMPCRQILNLVMHKQAMVVSGSLTKTGFLKSSKKLLPGKTEITGGT